MHVGSALLSLLLLKVLVESHSPCTYVLEVFRFHHLRNTLLSKRFELGITRPARPDVAVLVTPCYRQLPVGYLVLVVRLR